MHRPPSLQHVSTLERKTVTTYCIDVVMLSVMHLYGSLENYISSLRKEAGLSQDELSILLGLEGRASVARYENVLRLPELQTLIGLELVFDEPMQTIFAGVSERVRTDIPRRAQALLEGMGEKPSAQNAQKFETLARLARLEEEHTIPWDSAA